METKLTRENPSPQQAIRSRLTLLSSRLAAVRHTYAVGDYESLLRFQVKILPRVMQAERCSIFLLDPHSGRVWLKFGTGLKEKQIEAPLKGSIVGRVITSGLGVIENHLQQRTGFHTKVDSDTGFITRDMVCAPIRSRVTNEVTGAVQVLNRHPDHPPFAEDDLQLLTEVATLLAMSIDYVVVHDSISRISNQLSEELNRYQQAAVGAGGLVIQSRSMRRVLEQAEMVSATPVSVFIHGENGTGKEVVARLIHDTGERRNGPFVAINCAAIPESLIESEFFGYEKGAFTGADSPRKGRFEEAEGGTLFLDEVAEMPLAIQAKFLRAIQEREGVRLGSNRVIPYNFRLISATNADIRQRVADGRFREDLFYRLFSVEIQIPALRERREEILPLATSFLEQTQQRFGKWIGGLSQEVIELFEAHPWPGNVRQLRQEVERLVALTPEGAPATVAACSESLLHHRGTAAREPLVIGSGNGTLPEQVRTMEERLIRRALEQTAGNKVQAARILGITRQGLHKKITRYGLDG